MKQLIIGIDGGDEEILGYFQMPFYESLITKSKRLHLVEDCWSRGWAEMYTGMHARETKAFYELPNLDGTLKFNRRYSWKTSLENPKCKMLWDVLESQGVNSLFMNIPTTFPCPEMKHGCFVAGAGGGLNNVSEIPDGLCSDPSIKEDLNLAGYIVDLRYKTSGIKDLDELFEKLNQMMMKRAECFVTLCKKKKTEFGFLVFRATTIVQYVARSEIEELANLFKEYGNDYKPVKKIHKLLIGHFRLLDDALKHIFTELSPEKYIVTADHGCVPFKKGWMLIIYWLNKIYRVK